MDRLINAIGFQTAWWMCVLSIRHEFQGFALGLCVILAVIHLALSRAPFVEFKTGCWAMGLGILVDSSLQALSVIQFHGHALEPLSPFWTWSLWFLFALTLSSSLSFLQRMPRRYHAALGMVFGPSTYYAGAQLGAAEFSISWIPLLVLALAWMICLPVMVNMAQKFSQSSEVFP